MVYKNEIRDKIKTIIQKNSDTQATIVETIAHEFRHTLQLSKTSGISLRHITYSILEGVDEALSITPKDKDETLQKVSIVMVDVAYDVIKVDIEKIQSSPLNQEHMLEKIESEKVTLEDISEGFEEYILEKGYHLLAQSMERVETVTDAINYDLNQHKS